MAPIVQRETPWAEPLTDRDAPWGFACHQIDLALEDLTRAVAAACRSQPDRDEIQAALAAGIEEIRTGLRDFGLHLHATWTPALLETARHQLQADELIHLMDNNGFIELRLADTLAQALDVMAQRAPLSP